MIRRIVVMIGSDSDLKQAHKGLECLYQCEREGLVIIEKVYTNSIHRNTLLVLWRLFMIWAFSRFVKKIDCIIIGAGMANHLTGTCDAFLRNGLRDDKIVVIGVAFAGKNWDETLAAIVSIQQVPGTQVMFDQTTHVGTEGFLYACKQAVGGELKRIDLKPVKPGVQRSLAEARAAAEKFMKAEVH